MAVCRSRVTQVLSYGSHPATWARPHRSELDGLSVFKDLDHNLSMVCLSEVQNVDSGEGMGGKGCTRYHAWPWSYDHIFMDRLTDDLDQV